MTPNHNIRDRHPATHQLLPVLEEILTETQRARAEIDKLDQRLGRLEQHILPYGVFSTADLSLPTNNLTRAQALNYPRPETVWSYLYSRWLFAR